eukprot:scaffold13676_cov138-Isochrysis_galbana.AAC.6
MSDLRILSIGERWTVGVTKFILGSARGIALFRSAPSSAKLKFSLERIPCLAWGGNRAGSLSSPKGVGEARTEPAPGPNKTKRGPSELEQCWNTNLG